MSSSRPVRRPGEPYGVMAGAGARPDDRAPGPGAPTTMPNSNVPDLAGPNAGPNTGPVSTPDPKRRSRDVTDGYERAPARAMLRAIGMTDDDWGKPQVGIASSWNEVTPCNLPLD